MHGWRKRRFSAGLAWIVAALLPGSAMSAPALPPESLPGWPALDHQAVLSAFRASCEAAVPRFPAAHRDDFRKLCQRARTIGLGTAKPFFAAEFCALPPQDGKATGYFEPVIEGRLSSSPGFDTPLLTAPADLVSLQASEQTGALANLSHARRVEGQLVPLPPRAEIEAGALGQLVTPLVHVDRVEAFFAHIQGSVAVRLEDGQLLRLGFAGKNGHPYTAIGRLLVSQGEMRIEDVSMESLKAWLRANPDRAGALMRANASYIFFSRNETAQAGEGPRGALGVPLTPLLSAAVDPSHHPLGLPLIAQGGFSLDGQPFQRLMLAQDVGSAIRGAGRIDIYTGSGDQAGRLAGGLRQDVRIIQLLPRFMCGGAP